MVSRTDSKMTWRRRWWRWWKLKPSRRDTINAIVHEWRWTRSAATHAVDAWGFYPWKKVESDDDGNPRH